MRFQVASVGLHIAGWVFFAGAAQASSPIGIQSSSSLLESLSSSRSRESSAEFLRQNADLFRDLRIPGPELEDESLTAVTREFGEARLDVSALPYRSPMGDSGVRPWSAWWYPMNEALLSTETGSEEQPNSALGKYDFVRRKNWEKNSKQGPAPTSALEYERGSARTNGPSWEGLCDAWALASILVPEPKRSVTVQYKSTFKTMTTTFSVGDLKGLLLKTFEAAPSDGLRYFGQKFTGNYDGWIHPDVFPDQFHRFIEVQLFERKKPFIMDHDPGPEIWNVPVYKANYRMEAIPGQPNSVYVRMWLYSGAPVNPGEQDFVGNREMMREYHYVLTGAREADGRLRVTSGYWIKGANGVDSRRDHPDYFIELADPEKIVRKSRNPAIDVAWIDDLLKSSR